jgi:hypothetical protein
VFVFSYSEEIVSGLFEAIGKGDAESEAWRATVLAVDIAILAAVGWLKRRIGKIDGGAAGLWVWWWAGFAIVVVDDIAIDVLNQYPPLWVSLLASLVFAIAMGILMMSSLNADPMTLLSTRKRAALPVDWLRVRAVVPLIVGTLAAYVGATVWTDYFDLDVVRALDPEMAAEVAGLSLPDQQEVLNQLCTGGVSPRYFEHIAEVIPLLLLTLGIEFGFFRRVLRDPAQRAATAVTVTVMSAGLVFALSTLPWAGVGCGEVLSAWHEYLAFVISLQAVFTGLATLIWLLVVNVPDATSNNDSPPG